jgi:hypothetical protein
MELVLNSICKLKKEIKFHSNKYQLKNLFYAANDVNKYLKPYN